MSPLVLELLKRFGRGTPRPAKELPTSFPKMYKGYYSKTIMITRKLLLLFFTARHLKPVQIYWRFYLKLSHLLPFYKTINQPILSVKLKLLPAVDKYQSLADDRFFFLNQSAPCAFPMNWSDFTKAKLWLYNLHYFDYLNQRPVNKTLAINLINDWIQQNEVGEGDGWEPYPLSLRIVNWIKFLTSLAADADLNTINHSLYLQCRFLRKHLEYHLLGNHLFKNGVALMFAGAYFQGSEASNWLRKGTEIISQQVREQILADGGHFERSPMYHAIILDDILDCLNVNQASESFSGEEADFIKNKATRMCAFLADTLHPDGEIAFFNDSALGIAPLPQKVLSYASRLGIEQDKTAYSISAGSVSVVQKPEFGLYILQNQRSKMIFDAGAVGPDYLPGHAHCDTLSFELSVAGHRCIVNSGTYQYAGSERNNFRATAAHNTVRIDSEEQHEIWSTFRVARRGYPLDISVSCDGESARLTSAHDGYRRLPGHPIHRRDIICQPMAWEIIDRIAGQGSHRAESYIHLHPNVRILSQSPREVSCDIEGGAFLISALNDAEFAWDEGFYSSEFGMRRPNTILVLRKQGECPIHVSYKITLI